METREQIEEFKEYIETFHLSSVLSDASKELPFSAFDFRAFSRFSTELSQLLLEDPYNVIKAAEIALKSLTETDMRVRFYNLPDTENILIRDIRSKHLGKLVKVEGFIRRKTDVRPMVVSILFECPSCGNLLPVIQNETKIKEPDCGCGRKGKMRVVKKEIIDAQSMILEEPNENLPGSDQPKRLHITLAEDLVSPLNDTLTSPGTRVIITGIPKEIPSKGRQFDIVLEVNHLQALDDSFTDIIISKEEKETILSFSKQDTYFEMLQNSVAPGIHGHKRIKEAMLLQMFGGVKKENQKVGRRRNTINVLLIGSPGSGKSFLMKSAQRVCPKSRYTSGKSASGAGLTASLVRDEQTGAWALECGILPLCHKGSVFVDEIEKIGKEDTAMLHEALSQQTISVAKANINAVLQCETTMTAAANPKWGRFDPFEPIAKQLTMPQSLLNRFDLIFPIEDKPEKEKDTERAEFILDLHIGDGDGSEILTDDFIKKYVSYAKQNIIPKVSADAKKILLKYYLKLREKAIPKDGEVLPIPISPRQLEGLIRLSEAAAKSRLSSIVEQSDAERAVDLMDYCLKTIGIDPDTGLVDIDRIQGTAYNVRNKVTIIKTIIRELSQEYGKKIPFVEVEKHAKEQNINPEDVDDIVEKLKMNGDILEPRRGYVGLV